jgi:XTP/dITP diphosphohydrolase
MKALLATRNKGKLAELRALFNGGGLDLALPGDEDVPMPDVEETGATFLENALLKARALAAASHGWALADDSGLEVDALGGAPGVRSARYAGPGATDAANVARLLEALGTHEDRRARFRCVLALAGPENATLTATGTLEGEIARAPAGTGGFGYDPVFLLPDRGLTVAQLPFGEKQKISHRARAAAALLELLPRLTDPR